MYVNRLPLTIILFTFTLHLAMREPNEYQDSDLYIKEDLNSTECRRNT